MLLSHIDELRYMLTSVIMTDLGGSFSSYLVMSTDSDGNIWKYLLDLSLLTKTSLLSEFSLEYLIYFSEFRSQSIRIISS